MLTGEVAAVDLYSCTGSAGSRRKRKRGALGHGNGSNILDISNDWSAGWGSGSLSLCISCGHANVKGHTCCNGDGAGSAEPFVKH